MGALESGCLGSWHVTPRLNDTQTAMLRWLATEPADGEATNPQRLTARALATRKLVKSKGRGPSWHAALTDAGRHYLEHGEYPDGHFPTKRKPQPVPPQRQRPVEKPAVVHEVDHAVDSPAGKRRRGGRPAGDPLFTAEKPDPCDEKVLITVKEAAWMLSLPEHAIRQAGGGADCRGGRVVTVSRPDRRRPGSLGAFGPCAAGGVLMTTGGTSSLEITPGRACGKEVGPGPLHRTAARHRQSWRCDPQYRCPERTGLRDLPHPREPGRRRRCGGEHSPW